MFIFKEKSTEEAGVILSSIPPLPVPQRRKEKVYIDGRDGYLTFDNKSYDEFTLGFEGHVETNDIDEFRSWLHGSGKLIHGQYPDRYFRAEVINEVDIEKIKTELNLYRFSVLFVCQPFGYLITGETPIDATGGTSINNPYNLPSYPNVRVEGSGEIMLTVNSESITLYNVTAPVEINTELEYAHSQNTPIKTVGSFPTLKPGENTVEVVGSVSKLTVIPNWRIL